ncbi:hypothetical protein CCYA_CCYA09G2747 [Cyanidiococcus yangmingshanensis]|nr:hypothetical protein CCYA_CCYA09G2747 [Cyanidiococcus yangmingshanensis]
MAFVQSLLPSSRSLWKNHLGCCGRGDAKGSFGGRSPSVSNVAVLANVGLQRQRAQRRVRSLWLASTASRSPQVGAGASKDVPASSSKNGVPTSSAAPAKSDRMSQRAQSLRAFLRGHKSLFRAGDGFYTEVANTCKKNDTALLFVPLEELQSYRGRRGFQGADVAAVITTHAEAIVEAGLRAAQVKKELYEGKNLGLLTRTEAIEEQLVNDLSDQLRVVSYAVLAQEENAEPVDFLHKRNVALLLELYQELGLDLGRIEAGWRAMVCAMQELFQDPTWYNKRVKPAVDMLLTMLVGERWLTNAP